MPTVLVPEGDFPLADDWVVNDRTALYINIPLPEAGYPLACDMQNHEGEKDDKKYGMKDATTPESDTSSIKEWVHAKSKQMTMADVEGLDIDSIYKMGFAAGMQQKQASSSSA